MTIGPGEVFLLGVLLIVLFASDRLVPAARGLGKTLRALRDAGPRIEPGENPLIVFVSSVQEELAAERLAAQTTIRKLELARPWLFEFTPASTESPSELSRRKASSSHIFILILGPEVSQIVREEYEAARRTQRVCLAFLKKGQRSEAAEQFLTEISHNHKWTEFESTAEFRSQLLVALRDELHNGWLQGRYPELTSSNLALLLALPSSAADVPADEGELDLLLADASASAPGQTVASSYVQRGWSLYSDNKATDAIRMFDEAIRIDSRNAEAFFMRGRSHDFLDEGDLALPDLFRALELLPQDSRVHRAIGIDLYTREDYPRSIDFLNRALELDPDEMQALTFRGLARRAVGNEQAAVADFRTAVAKLDARLDTMPDHLDALLDRADLKRHLGDARGAVRDAEHAVAIRGNAKAYLSLARSYVKAGRRNDAVRAYRMCAGLRDDPASARVARVELRSLTQGPPWRRARA